MITLESFRLRNFKAVRDTEELKFGAFTIIVGANGSGKSSLLEGIEVYHSLGTSDVDAIFNEPRWRGFHHVWNKAVPHPLGPTKEKPRLLQNPMGFDAVINRQPLRRRYELLSEITQSDDGEVIISRETVQRSGGIGRADTFERDSKGKVSRIEPKNGVTKKATSTQPPAFYRTIEPGVSILASGYAKPFGDWQFLNLQAGLMGQPTARLGGKLQRGMASDGSNLAEVVRKLSDAGLQRLVESLRQIIGYAGDLEVDEFSPVDRTVYLKLQEGDFQIPGWLLSGGTMRLVAILACLYRDVPPPLLVIEEIENGLDPRTVGFLVNQIHEVLKEGKTQIIVTTHSPFFLSQATLDHLLLCQRDSKGEPHFWRPSDSKELKEWSEDFNPGDLYSTGRIQKAMKKALGDK